MLKTFLITAQVKIQICYVPTTFDDTKKKNYEYFVETFLVRNDFNFRRKIVISFLYTLAELLLLSRMKKFVILSFFIREEMFDEHEII